MAATRQVVAEALVRVSIWVGSCAGLTLIALASITGQPGVFWVGVCTALVGVAGLIQRHRAITRPLPILMLASVNGLILAPFSDRVAHAAILPALTLFAFVGVLAMPKRTASWYAFWCGGIGLLSLIWIIPGLTGAEFVAGAVMYATIAFAGWHFLSLAGDLLEREEESHRVLFQDSPVALLEEDFTAVAARLDELRDEGVTDLERHLSEHPQVIGDLIAMIRVRRANQAALNMIGGDSIADLDLGLRTAERAEAELTTFVQQFHAIWDGRTEIAFDLEGATLTGDRIEAVLIGRLPSMRGNPT